MENNSPVLSTPIYVGTSGYKFNDWVGTFYPSDISPYGMLGEYCKYFNFLELTYTFYKMPFLKTTQGISERIGKKTKISVRLNKVFLKGKFTDEDVITFKEGIKPLIENGQCCAFLCDFNIKFTSCKANLEYMIKLKEVFNEVPIFFELPSCTWYKERYLDEMRQHMLGIVVLDMPSIKGLAPYYPIATNSNVYFRLYGKSPMWLTPESKVLKYSYSENELKKIIKDIEKMSIISRNIFVSFCNLENGRAPINAVMMNKLLEVAS